MSSDWPAELVRRSPQSAEAFAIAEIRTLIEQRGLQPGDRLPSARELALLLGVSRPIVQNALARLQAQGRVRLLAGRGTFVARADQASAEVRRELVRQNLDLVRGVLEMTQYLEIGLVRAAAELGIPDDRVAELEDLIERMRSSEDAVTAAALDHRFHDVLLADVTGSWLSAFKTEVRSKFPPGVLTGLVRLTHDDAERRDADHRALLAAIAGRDPEAAERASRAHSTDSSEALREFIDREFL